MLYFSVHRYDDASFFPYSRDAAADRVGVGKGAGFNVNCAWNVPLKDNSGMGDADYFAVFQSLLLPIATEFAPDIILVSAGFDAAKGERYGCCVTPEGFGLMTQMLRMVCPAMVMVLEGGYELAVLSACVVACMQALKQPITSDTNKQVASLVAATRNPKAAAVRSINSTLIALHGYWSKLPETCVVRATATVGDKDKRSKHKGSSKRERRTRRRRDNKAGGRFAGGCSIAVRNTALSKHKADVRKLRRAEKQAREQLQRITQLRSNIKSKKKMSKTERRLFASEHDLEHELELVVGELNDLLSLSKEEVVRYYASAVTT